MNFLDELAEICGGETEKPALRIVEPVPPPAPETSPAFREWDRCKPWIEAALEGGFYDIAHIEAMLKRPANPAQFWPGKNAAIVTEVQDHGSHRVLFVWAAGGDMDEIIAMAPGIEAVGRLLGCQYAMSEGRSGWQRVMKRHGFETFSVTIRKAL
jgi:hypothetical protein